MNSDIKMRLSAVAFAAVLVGVGVSIGDCR